MSPWLSVHHSIKNPTSAARYRRLIRHSRHSVHVVKRTALDLAPPGILARWARPAGGLLALSSALLTQFLTWPRATGSEEGTALRKGEETCV